MKVTTERLDDCQVNVFIELDAAEIDKKLRQTARKLSRQFTVPGYRRGRAPLHAVIRIFGREAIQQQALEEFGNDLYEQALEEIEYELYQAGDLQDVEWDPFRMTVLVPIKPEVDLGDYRAVRVPFEVEEIGEEQIEEYLEGLRQENAQWVPVERPAALGDQVVLDLKAIADEKVIADNENAEILLQAEASYPFPYFHKEIVGLAPGEEKTFVLAVPEDDSDESTGSQEATVTVRLHTIKEHDLPTLDDELAMMVGDYDTLDDLKASVRERLETEARQKTESEYLDKVLEAMIETAVQIEYPSQAIDREADLALNQMERNLAASGMQLDTFLGMMGKTRETYKQELHSSAEERLRRRLVLNEIIRQEGLEAEPEKVDAEIVRLSEMLGPDASQMREMLDSPDGRQSVAEDMAITQAQERVVQIGKGEAQPLEKEDEAEMEAPPETAVEESAAEAVIDAEEQEAEDEAEVEVKAEEPVPAAVEEAPSGEDVSPEEAS